MQTFDLEQNDLRKLDELGYVEWIKHGSARHYTISVAGAKQLEDG